MPGAQALGILVFWLGAGGFALDEVSLVLERENEIREDDERRMRVSKKD